MQIPGEGQKIRALFRDLRLEDERLTPRFSGVLKHAQSRAIERRTSLDALRVAAALLFVCLILFSLALLSGPWRRSPRPNYEVASEAVKPDASSPEMKKDQEGVQAAGQDPFKQVVHGPRPLRFAARSQPARLTTKPAISREVVAIARWQSPTAGLLRSPGDELLTSLPQLNQTLREMKSFLPD